MTGSGFEDRRERALLAALNPLSVMIRKLIAFLTSWSSPEASKRNSYHPF